MRCQSLFEARALAVVIFVKVKELCLIGDFDMPV